MRGFRAEMGGQFWHEGQTELNGSEIRWQDPEALGQSTAAGRCALLAGGCLL